MRTVAWCVLVAGFLAAAGGTRAGTNPVISSFAENGEVSFSPHPFGTNHWVEWAPSASGPWTNSWDKLRNIVPTGRTHTISVPMFYRVVCSTASNEVQVKLTVDNRFWLYVSTNDSVTGTLIGSKIVDNYDYVAVVLDPIALVPGVTNYLHIVAQDVGVIAGLLGEFYLNTPSFRFLNGRNYIVSCSNGWWVSRTGFGNNYEAPAEINANRQELFVPYSNWPEIHSLSRDAIWIWTGNQFNIGVTRYFSLPIVPVP